MTVLECRSITLCSNDWRACRRFYVDLLGQGVKAEADDRFLALEGSPLCIDAAHGRPVSGGSLLFRSKDLDDLRARAGTMGYPIVRESDQGVYFSDPDGREVKVYSD